MFSKDEDANLSDNRNVDDKKVGDGLSITSNEINNDKLKENDKCDINKTIVLQGDCDLKFNPIENNECNLQNDLKSNNISSKNLYVNPEYVSSISKQMDQNYYSHDNNELSEDYNNINCYIASGSIENQIVDQHYEHNDIRYENDNKFLESGNYNYINNKQHNVDNNYNNEQYHADEEMNSNYFIDHDNYLTLHGAYTNKRDDNNLFSHNIEYYDIEEIQNINSEKNINFNEVNNYHEDLCKDYHNENFNTQKNNKNIQNSSNNNQKDNISNVNNDDMLNYQLEKNDIFIRSNDFRPCITNNDINYKNMRNDENFYNGNCDNNDISYEVSKNIYSNNSKEIDYSNDKNKNSFNGQSEDKFINNDRISFFEGKKKLYGHDQLNSGHNNINQTSYDYKISLNLQNQKSDHLQTDNIRNSPNTSKRYESINQIQLNEISADENKNLTIKDVFPYQKENDKIKNDISTEKKSVKISKIKNMDNKEVKKRNTISKNKNILMNQENNNTSNVSGYKKINDMANTYLQQSFSPRNTSVINNLNFTDKNDSNNKEKFQKNLSEEQLYFTNQNKICIQENENVIQKNCHGNLNFDDNDCSQFMHENIHGEISPNICDNIYNSKFQESNCNNENLFNAAFKNTNSNNTFNGSGIEKNSKNVDVHDNFYEEELYDNNQNHLNELKLNNHDLQDISIINKKNIQRNNYDDITEIHDNIYGTNSFGRVHETTNNNAENLVNYSPYFIAGNNYPNRVKTYFPYFDEMSNYKNQYLNEELNYLNQTLPKSNNSNLNNLNTKPSVMKPDETHFLNKKPRKTKKQPYEYDVTRMYVKGRKNSKKGKRNNSLVKKKSLLRNDFDDKLLDPTRIYECNFSNRNIDAVANSHDVLRTPNIYPYKENNRQITNNFYNMQEMYNRQNYNEDFVQNQNAFVYNGQYNTTLNQQHNILDENHNSHLIDSENGMGDNENAECYIFSCDPCMKKFKRLSTLKIHIFSHIKEAYIFKCPKVNCETGFKSQSIAIKHIQHFHANEKAILIEHIKRSKFSSVFRSYTTLLDYYRKYHPNTTNPFIGNFCFGCFTYPRSLKDHPCSKMFYSLTQCPSCRCDVSFGELGSHVESTYCIRMIPVVRDFE
ncbi:hypothetical protein COBT_000569 [Conglomerata obtusa]